jgi:hypothetical protein
MMRSVRVYRAFRSGACFGPRSERGDRRQIDVRRNLEEIRTAGRRAAPAHTVPPAGARYSFRGNVGTSGTTTNTVTEHAVSEIRRRLQYRITTSLMTHYQPSTEHRQSELDAPLIVTVNRHPR